MQKGQIHLFAALHGGKAKNNMTSLWRHTLRRSAETTFSITRNAVRCSLREHLSYIIIQKTDPVTISIICSLYYFKNNLEWLSWSYQPTFVSTTLPKSHSVGTHRGPALLLGVRGSGLHPDGHGHPETTVFNILNNFCFNNITKKSFPGAPRHPGTL